jgi:anti-sigma factor RsiW
MNCEFAELDGAYVLGSLSPGERQAYEKHLATCESCSRSVRELAGLPGLLAQVDVADLEGGPQPPVPDTLLPSLVREVRGAQRRRSFLVAGVAAGLTAVAVGSIAVV